MTEYYLLACRDKLKDQVNAQTAAVAYLDSYPYWIDGTFRVTRDCIQYYCTVFLISNY